MARADAKKTANKPDKVKAPAADVTAPAEVQAAQAVETTETSGKNKGLVNVTVRRGRSIVHDGHQYMPGQSFTTTREERARLAYVGSIVNDFEPDFAPLGRGPDFGHEKEKAEEPYVIRTT